MTPSLAEPLRSPTDARPVRWTVVVLCFLTVLLDGLDTTAIGFVVPTLARDWGLPPAAFTPTFVATSLGAVIGYVLSGQLSARFGRRGVVVGSVLLFALGSAATAWAASVPVLAWLRLFTGVGLGAALPAAIALGVENGPAERKEVVAIGVAAGLAMGATLGGLLGGPLMARFGWQSVFVVGAVLPALLLPLLVWGLPKEAARTVGPTSGNAGIGRLLDQGRAPQTVLLWVFAFLTFTALYALNFWTPTLLVSYGFSPAQAPLGVAALGMGGVLGSIVLVPLASWFGIRRVLIGSSLSAGLLIAVVSQTALGPVAVLAAFGGIGSCLIAGTVGQSALAVALYPSAARTTGVGWAAACGRVGSMVGPALGGLLMSLGHAPRDVVLTAGAPVALAVLVLLFMGTQPPREH